MKSMQSLFSHSMLCHREVLTSFVLFSLVIGNSLNTFCYLCFCPFAGEKRVLLSQYFPPRLSPLFLSHFLDNERWYLNLVPYFIECKIVSIIRWAFFSLLWSKKKQCCLNYSVMLFYHLKFLFCTYQKNSFRVKHIFIIFHTCANIKSEI